MDADAVGSASGLRPGELKIDIDMNYDMGSLKTLTSDTYHHRS